MDDNNNVFGNIGYFERAPFFEAIFPTFNNDEINEEAINQKIFSAELGYGVRTEKFKANINLYRTEWNDRTEVFTTDEDPTGDRGFLNIQGVDALHQGLEFDFEYKPFEGLSITGFMSYGDWEWKTPSTVAFVFNGEQELQQVRLINLDDLPVSGSNQTTSAIGITYNILPKTKISLDYNYYGRNYGRFDVDDRGVALSGINENSSIDEINAEVENTLLGDNFIEPVQLPDYFLFDVSLQHKFKVGQFEAVLNARVNNAFNEEYLTFANDIQGDINQALVHFGRGRTFSVGTKVNF